MIEEHKCEICRKEFAGLEALAQHQKDKHNINNNIKKGNEKLYLYGFAVLIIIFVAWAIFSAISSSNSCETAEAKKMNIDGHKNLALHIHPNLKIIIDGRNETIPANIGLTQNVMKPIHTHDASGKLHIEGLCVRNFTLRDFFSIWEKQFNAKCIFNYCTDKGELKMSVNGKENFEFENYSMKDNDDILIEYISKEN